MHINNHCSARSSVQDSVVRILLGVESLQVGSALDVDSLQMCLASSDFLFFFFPSSSQHCAEGGGYPSAFLSLLRYLLFSLRH